ncbi:cyclic-phosphate processing receiver domain-containing protein [Vibrio chaetopteri]|uniref:cyclic-phosphate processing receiver domain-containing protein n=1 Tax=Vibrio chaetopteri TaxID=3016528 RepID=UPI003AB6D80B
MRVYLDDERETPSNYVRVYWPDEAIALLKTGDVTEISLDHDLGNDERGTGYDVLLWIERAVYTENFVPPLIYVHSANSSARLKMQAAIENINIKASSERGSI